VQSTFDVKPQNTIVAVGQSVLLDCKAVGAPKPTIKWYFDTERTALSNSSSYTIYMNGSLSINNIAKDQFGDYKCEAKNLINSPTVVANVKKACKYTLLVQYMCLHITINPA
jgi:hypothetical protein